jgi:hypothetical protein
VVAALAEFHIPQAAASSVTGHPHWQLTAALGLADLPLEGTALAALIVAGTRLARRRATRWAPRPPRRHPVAR